MLLASAPPAFAGSVGVVDNGRLVGAAELSTEGAHHYILPRRHRARGLRYGTRPLVALLQEAAAAVAQRFPGSRLGVGNLGRKRGGRIRYSYSHQTGRDADLAFYMRDARDRPHLPRDLVRFGPTGRSRTGLRFDVARTWALVDAMLSSKLVSLQWLLISEPLKAMLLSHGRKLGASAELLQRAAETLHQPRWALPHDDHLHVRIYCPAEDLSAGCRNSGPVRSWMESSSVEKAN